MQYVSWCLVSEAYCKRAGFDLQSTSTLFPGFSLRVDNESFWLLLCRQRVSSHGSLTNPRFNTFQSFNTRLEIVFQFFWQECFEDGRAGVAFDFFVHRSLVVCLCITVVTAG